MYIEKTIGHKRGIQPGVKDIQVFGSAVLEPFEYKSDNSISLKMLLLLNLRNVLCKSHSLFVAGSCVSFNNFFLSLK